MKKIILIFPIVVLLLGCNFFNENDSLEGLGLERHPYIGKELRTDGYYLATKTHKNMLGLIVLYRNGVCLCTYVENSGKSTKQYIENDVLQNKSYMHRLWSKPTAIGVFMKTKRTIALRTWEYQNKRSTIAIDNVGEIINDTTLRINTIARTYAGIQQFVYNVYHFVPFSNKPDSTTSFIKWNKF